MNQLIINSLIWLVSHWQIQPCFFVHDTLIMGESPEAFTAMITTHTTFTKSPKRHFTGREMDNSVVDTATTELALRQWLYLLSSLSRRKALRYQFYSFPGNLDRKSVV